MGNALSKLKLAFCLVAVVVASGTVGYRIAGLDWEDALYQTVITVTTVGYADSAEHLDVKAYTVVMIGVGTLTIALFISLITGAVVESQIRDYFGRRKVEGKVRRLTDHIVVCGYGRFGRIIADALARRGATFVLLEHDAAKAESAREHDYLVLEADATEEESLERAGIERAAALLTTLGTDAANVYVTLTAKQIKRSLKVVAIALDDRAGNKLKAAGADEVVSPFRLGGNWMAQAATSPTVADFMKMATGANPLDFYMDEQQIGAASSLCGRQLKETDIRSDLGVIVVALRRAGGELITNPASDTELGAGDVIVSLGARDQLARLHRIASGNGGS